MPDATLSISSFLRLPESNLREAHDQGANNAGCGSPIWTYSENTKTGASPCPKSKLDLRLTVLAQHGRAASAFRFWRLHP
jgi:hypothetical protein